MDFYIRLYFQDDSAKVLELPLLRRMADFCRCDLEINLCRERALPLTHRETMDDENREIVNELSVRYKMMQNGGDKAPDGVPSDTFYRGGKACLEDASALEDIDYIEGYLADVLVNVRKVDQEVREARKHGCTGIFEFVWQGDYLGGFTLPAKLIRDMAEFGDEIRFFFENT